MLGAFGYILKPIDKNNLIELMKKVFNDLTVKKQEEEKAKRSRKKLSFSENGFSMTFSEEKNIRCKSLTILLASME